MIEEIREISVQEREEVNGAGQKEKSSELSATGRGEWPGYSSCCRPYRCSGVFSDDVLSRAGMFYRGECEFLILFPFTLTAFNKVLENVCTVLRCSHS